MNKELVTSHLLETAACLGNIEECSRLVKMEGACVDGGISPWNSTGAIPLHLAVQGGHEKLVQVLVKDLSADVDAVNSRGLTACAIAVRENQLTMIQLLVQELRANPNISDVRGRTPMYVAAMNGQCAVVKLLLDLGANPNLASINGRTPAYVAAQEGHLSVIRVLGEGSADFDLPDQEGRTPVFVAAMWGNTPVLRVLSLTFGADVTVVDHNGWTPIAIASANGSEANVRLLVEEVGVSVESPDLNGSTNLHIAATQGHESVVRMLVSEFGADVEARNVRGRTPIFGAAQSGYCDIVRLLVTIYEANPLHIDIEGWTPVMVAVFHGRDSTVRTIIQLLGVDVNTADSNGWTLVLIAAQQGNDSCIRLLSELGADINRTNHGNRSPLYICSKRGHLSTVRLLIELGADMEGASTDAALRVAGANGHQEIFDTLIRTRTIRNEARNGDIDGIFSRILGGNIPPSKQWQSLLSSHNRQRLRNKISLTTADTHWCYAVLYGPAADDSTFRMRVCHDGNPHIQKLISSFLVPREASSRKILREIMHDMQDEHSGASLQPPVHYIGILQRVFLNLFPPSILANVLTFSLVLLASMYLSRLRKNLPNESWHIHIHEHPCLEFERVPDRFVDEVVVLRGCYSPSNTQPLNNWSQVLPYAGQPPVPRGAVKMQTEPNGFYYFDKTRPWASNLKPQHKVLDRELTLEELWRMFNVSGGEHPLQVLPGSYSTVRLPAAMSSVLATSLSHIKSTLPRDLSESFVESASKHAPNLWLASPGAFALPHYDLQHNVILHLQGPKRFWLATPSNHRSHSAMPLHPSLHPHWRHLIGNSVRSDPFDMQLPKSILGRYAKVVELNPGDALVIPPYYFHATEASSLTTVSLNVWFGEHQLETKLREIVLPLDSSSRLSDIVAVISEIALVNWHFGTCAHGVNAQDTKPLLSEIRRRCNGLAWATENLNFNSHLRLLTESRPSLFNLVNMIEGVLSGEADCARRIIALSDYLEEIAFIAYSKSKRDGVHLGEVMTPKKIKTKFWLPLCSVPEYRIDA